MRHLLQDIKTILEYERAVFGAFVPLFDARSVESEDVRATSASRVSSGDEAVAKSPSSTVTSSEAASTKAIPAGPAAGHDTNSRAVSSNARSAGAALPNGASSKPPQPDTASPESPAPGTSAAESDRKAATAEPGRKATAEPGRKATAEPGRKGASGEKPQSHGAPTETPSFAEKPDAMSASDLFSPTAPAPRDQSRSPYERIHALIPDDSPLCRLKTLEEAEDYVRSTVLIPLDKTRRNAVFGVGSPTADIMVIGEAPGADEDEQGEPFVGRAGQLLTKILKAIGFEREDVYIANILKSRPPNNRDPLAAEVEAHVPILYKQIALIQPKLILCVGRTSGTTLLNKRTSLGALRQKFHDWHGLPVLVTYHPAALLRNPNWKKPTWDDVQLLRKRYDELVEAPETA